MLLLKFAIGTVIIYLVSLCSVVLSPIIAILGIGLVIWFGISIFGLIDGTVQLQDFLTLIGCTFLVGVPLVLIFAFASFVGGFIISIGDVAVAIANRSWLGFWS